MDKILTPRLVELVNETTNIEDVVLRLLSKGVLRRWSSETICAEKTSMGKASRLYNFLTRRPESELDVLLDVLEETSNGHLCDLLGRKKKTENNERCDMFDEMLNAVRSMRPVETTTDRSNLPVYKVSVNVYSGKLPLSRVGLNDLPYVMALKLGTSRASVLAWATCPSGPVLDSVLATYDSEIESASAMVRELRDCSVEIECVFVPAMANAVKTMAAAAKTVYVNRLSWNTGDAEGWNDHMLKNTASILHLLTYGRDFSLNVRKDFKPKPSSYLFLNPNTGSFVIRPFDRQIVMPVLGSDESNVDGGVGQALEPRPF